jgi:anti-sigma factor RsiW
MVLLLFVTCRSQSESAIHKKPERVRRVMTYADFQGNRASASSNPAVSDRVARSKSAAPTKSILLRVSFLIMEEKLRCWRLACLWYGNPFGIAMIVNASAGTAAGTLDALVTTSELSVQTYFSRNTQRHVVFALIAPPMIGPVSNESAYTLLRFAAYLANCSGGTISVIRADAIAKQPPPPTPWNARKTILFDSLAS